MNILKSLLKVVYIRNLPRLADSRVFFFFFNEFREASGNGLDKLPRFLVFNIRSVNELQK